VEPAGAWSRRFAGLGSSLALHLAAIALVAAVTGRALPVGRQTRDSGSGARRVRVSPESVPPDATMRPDPRVEVPDHHETIELPGFHFDYRKVAARAASLFPFVTGSPSLEMIVNEPHVSIRGLLERAAAVDELTLPRPALAMSDQVLQSTIDAAWSRRDRWRVFTRLRELADHYDGNRGRVPDLFRAYEQQDGLQPYVDASFRDARLWTELGLASDHEDFIDFISTYCTDHPATKARTELLFLLDKIAQASYDALVTLLDAIPEEDLQWTQAQNPSAYAALVRIHQAYRLALERRGLGTRAALRRYYDAARSSILIRVIESTPRGYRANDARYLIGAIDWRAGRGADAIQWWRALDIDPTDSYVGEYSRLAAMVQSGQPLDASTVNQILNAGRGRWLSFSATRLRQFGYHFDTY
jgi:hypothetical protein